VFDGTGVLVGIGVFVGIGVLVGIGVGVLVGVGVFVGVGVGVLVGVGVFVRVGVGVFVAVGIGEFAGRGAVVAEGAGVPEAIGIGVLVGVRLSTTGVVKLKDKFCTAPKTLFGIRVVGVGPLATVGTIMDSTKTLLPVPFVAKSNVKDPAPVFRGCSINVAIVSFELVSKG
jgi:hypothetical protein